MATKKKTKKIAVLADGTRLPVTGEKGRYIQCGGRQFRKMNVTIEREPEDREEKTENEEA